MGKAGSMARKGQSPSQRKSVGRSATKTGATPTKSSKSTSKGSS